MIHINTKYFTLQIFRYILVVICNTNCEVRLKNQKQYKSALNRQLGTISQGVHGMDTGYYRIDLLISKETSIHELVEDGKTQPFRGKFTNSLYNQESDFTEVSFTNRKHPDPINV